MNSRLKKLSCLLLLAASECIVVSMAAQNTLTQRCNLMQPGDSVTLHVVDYVDAGTGGENAIWDFCGLDSIGVYYIKFDTIKHTQLAGFDFQNIYKFSQDRNLLLLSAKESALQGTYYLHPQLLQAFPFQYGQVVSKEYKGEGRYCGTHYERTFGNVQITADGQGTLILSEKDTLLNTLRVYTVNTAAIRLNSDSCRNDSDNLKQIITERYQWFTRGYRYPVFETVTSSTYDNTNHVSTQQHAYCCPPSIQAMISDPINEEIRQNDALAGHNQNNKDNEDTQHKKGGDRCVFNYDVTLDGAQIHLVYDVSESAHIHIMVVDIMGIVYRDVEQASEVGSNVIDIDCAGLRNGQYILYMNVNGSVYNHKVTIK